MNKDVKQCNKVPEFGSLLRLKNAKESHKVQMINESQIPEGCSLKGYSSDGDACYGHDEYDGKPFRMTINDVFHLNGGGICYLKGCIEEGSVRTNDVIYI